MSNVSTLYVGNDTVLEVKGLKNEVTGAYLNAAAVTATLVDSYGAQVTGQSWPLTLAYVAGSDGIYRGTMSYSMAIASGARYTAQVTADGGAGLQARFDLPCVARHRE